MPSVSLITARLTFIFCLLTFVTASAQENSPYSRYGIGDLYPSKNIANRGMAGLSVASTNVEPLGQAINFSNPASYAYFQRFPGVGARVIYDLGVSVDSRSLSSKAPIKEYSSANFIPSYISLGFPLAKNLGGVFAVKPYSRISYSIIQNSRINNVDSAQYLYEGSGGLNQAFLGLGKRWGNFSIGVNAGYFFGRKETNTRLAIINTDTNYTPFYYKSNSGTTTYLNKFFLQTGAMYDITLKTLPATQKRTKQTYGLRLGATAMLKQTFKGSQDIVKETFEYDASGGAVSLDSVYRSTGTSINVDIPAVYTIGAMFHKANRIRIEGNNEVDERAFDIWSVGFELETSKWSQYRFGGLSDRVRDYWQFRLGGQFLPSQSSSTLFGRSTYRFGVAVGRDYIDADGKGLKTFTGTLGVGLPIALKNNFYSSQFTNINMALEFGKRGSNVNNITENFIRVSVGLSLTDLWFRKRRYD